jgi:hypothetical protein
MSSYSDHQHTPDRKPKQLQYTRATGTSSNTIPEQEGHTLESNDSISTNLTEKVSHQTTNEYPNHQTKNQQHQDHSQRTPATMENQHNATHQQLSKSLHHQQHQILLHRLPPRLHNELRDIYKPLYGEPLEALEDLAALGTLLDQEDQEDPLLLQLPQQPQQLQHLPIVMTDSWGAYPSLTRETENSPEHSLTSWFTTSGRTHRSQD